MATATAPLPAAVPARRGPEPAPRSLPRLYAATLFVSAVLLFLIQPMFAKMVLPLVGGSPAVWNSCMVFYQAALLAGYAYAHFTTGWLGVRRQALLHGAVLLLPLAVLPVGVAGAWLPSGDANPVPWLLGLLAVSVGLPFVVVSASAPLLQKWFAGTGHPSARDPYFLYAASNLGSMLALFLYPAAVEPCLTLTAQSWCWAGGYGLLVLLVLSCAVQLWRLPADAARAPDDDLPAASRPPLGRRLHWVALALVPSSLLLGATTHLTTDLAAIPLLWVLPLALYLLSFILAFSPALPGLHGAMTRLMPVTTLALLAKTFMGLRLSLTADLALHLGGFFVIALVCHGELARLRPAPRHLTAYYLLMSLGGVLGGLCNALLAPLVFTTTLEYPLALVAACLLKPALERRSKGGSARRAADLLLPLLIGIVAAVLAWIWNGLEMSQVAATLGDKETILLRLGTCLAPVVLCYLCRHRPLRFALAAGALLAAGQLCHDPNGFILFRQRGFFGQLAVQYDAGREHLCLMHGTTLHGQQSLDPKRRDEPLSYYHRTGPAGQVFAMTGETSRRRRVAVLGLGVGTLASYARPGESWTFYEIDPHVVHVARDSGCFHYLADCADRGVEPRIILGDARLRLTSAPEAAYDLVVVDVFSSDAVPTHLLTREAVQLYKAKLAAGGALLLNVSNRHLDLEPVLARIAEESGLFGYSRYDTDVEDHPGKSASKWVVLARDPKDLDGLARGKLWQPLVCQPGAGVWTDDFSNLLGVFLWKK